MSKFHYERIEIPEGTTAKDHMKKAVHSFDSKDKGQLVSIKPDKTDPERILCAKVKGGLTHG